MILNEMCQNRLRINERIEVNKYLHIDDAKCFDTQKSFSKLLILKFQGSKYNKFTKISSIGAAM